MSQGRVNPKRTLEDQGITGLGEVYYNLIEPALIEQSLRRGESTLGKGGTLLVSTGKFTGRSPKDKHVVRSATTEERPRSSSSAPRTASGSRRRLTRRSSPG